jgi:hypothetical protein
MSIILILLSFRLHRATTLNTTNLTYSYLYNIAKCYPYSIIPTINSLALV